MRSVAITIGAFLSLMSSCVVAGPSFQCNGVLNVAENLVCSDKVLSRLDEMLADEYEQAKVSGDVPDDLQRD